MVEEILNHRTRQAPPPAPAQGGGSILGGIGSTIAQGMAFGTGSAMAHRAVDAVMGPRTIQHETVATEATAAAATPMVMLLDLMLAASTQRPFKIALTTLFYSRGPVPDRRDRSPSEQCCAAGEATGPWQSRPVPERVCAGRDQSRAGRDRFPNVGFSGQAERPVPSRGDRSLWAKTAQTGLIEREGEEGEGEERSLLRGFGASSSFPFLTLVALSLRLELVEDQTSTLLGFELGLKLLLRFDWKDSSSHLVIERASFAIGASSSAEVDHGADPREGDEGQSVAVDTYSWLHKGALSCASNLCKSLPTSRHIDYCMHRVNLLRHYGVKPILVFDGGLLPIKIDQETKRARVRKENLECAMEHEAAGNSAAAFECYQKAVDITPSIAFQLIQEKVDYIVAPYEADAQMTFLSISKLVDAVITEDSDLIPFGCSRIIFKMDKFGQGVEFRSSELGQNKEFDFAGFSKQMVLQMCILSGCDCLQSLPGMGLKRAHALIQKLKSYDKVIKHLRYCGVSVPPFYEENFKKAIQAFQHQRVYDPAKDDIVHLSDIPHDIGLASTEARRKFRAPKIMPKQSTTIESSSLSSENEESDSPVSAKDNMEAEISFEGRNLVGPNLDASLKAIPNSLTFKGLASLEMRRKFRAPNIMPKESATDELPLRWCYRSSFTDCVSIDLEMEAKFSDERRNLLGLNMDGQEHQISKLFLASHKENDSSAKDSNESNKISTDRKVIVRSAYFRHKLSDENDQENPSEEPLKNKENSYVDGDFPMSRDAAMGNITHRSIIKKRKLGDVHKIPTETRQLKSMQESSAICEEGGGIADFENEVADTNVGGKFGCDISHLKNYKGIAEKSMEKFVSLIASFRYTSSGSRASGLRAPLKDVQNTCLARSTVGAVDLTKFSYATEKRLSEDALHPCPEMMPCFIYKFTSFPVPH
uniref:Exonuclease 1 n=1 Tax=Ananas comosus var. bracteatus TaxID=296719 RepID=A0A6V7PAQ7_ANACO|nr:unnamed protein product [Ananas comosus var. bracteatus]